MDQLNTHSYCLLCAGSVDAPKMLDCQHVFCRCCLQMYYEESDVIQYNGQEAYIPCPVCRDVTPVPRNGIAALRDGSAAPRQDQGEAKVASTKTRQCDVCPFKAKATSQEAAYYCSKCALNLCDWCHGAHGQQPLFRSHQVMHVSNKDAPNLFCSAHDGLQSKYFCVDCKLPACAACVMLQHGAGAGHHVVDLRSALSLHRDSLRTLLNRLGPSLDRLEYGLRRLRGLASSSSSTHEKNGLGLSGGESPGSRSPSTRSLSAVDVGDCRSPSGDRPAEKSPSSGSAASLRLVHHDVENIRRVFDLSTAVLEASQSRDLLRVYDDLAARIRTILDRDMPRIENARRRISPRRAADQPIQNTPPSSSSAPSTCSLPEHADGPVPDVDVDVGVGGPTEPERPSLLVKPNLIWKLEKQRSDVGELYNPCDVDFLDADGDGGCLIVAEYDVVSGKNNRLKVFDRHGRTRDVLAQGKVCPLGLAVTVEGNIVVTDCKDKRLKLYSPGGQLLTEIGKGQFGWPYGVAVNGRRQIVVTDAFNDNVSIYQADGKKIKQFGSSGTGGSQFKNPYHVAVDARDNIIVSDCGNNCIKVFDPFGRFMFWTSEIRKKPSADYGEPRKSKRKRLKGPRGVCVDHKGNILVADEYSRVCMFDECGNFVRNILTEEDGVKYPEAISCSKRGHIAVTEWNPNNMLAIKLFHMYE